MFVVPLHKNGIEYVNTGPGHHREKLEEEPHVNSVKEDSEETEDSVESEDRCESELEISE
jgi:hypothetical protein